MTKKIDKTDTEIIKILQKDGRTPNTEIAKKLGLNEATVRKRLQRLIKDKTITIVAMGTGLGAGGIAGSMSIHADFKKLEHVKNELKKINEIWFMVQTIGKQDFELEYYVDDTDAFSKLYSKIQQIDGIVEVEKSLYTELIIEKYDWSLPIHRM
ncbi:MAG: Lrp/AsnC family transcriptional regulator [Desulfobacterales bacterium]|nr:Lrp/AsnC family transcriptional regulator [Desulfobacterales bacterium]